MKAIAESAIEPEPFPVTVGNHRQLLAQSKYFQVEQGAASKEAGQGGEHREKDCLHPRDVTDRDEKKSTKPIGTRFLVGTGQTRLHNGQRPASLSLQYGRVSE
jgi:hypothetical protein